MTGALAWLAGSRIGRGVILVLVFIALAAIVRMRIAKNARLRALAEVAERGVRNIERARRIAAEVPKGSMAERRAAFRRAVEG